MLSCSQKKLPLLKNNKGFTLLEVLIAVTILSLLMVSIYSIIDNSTETKDRVMTEDRDKMSFEMAMNRLENDIENIYSPLYFEATKREDEALYNKAFAGSKASQANDEDDEDNLSVYDEKKNRYDSLEQYAGISEYGHPIPRIINDDQKTLIFFSSSGRRLLKNSKVSRFQWIKYSIENAPSKENDEEVNKDAPLALYRSVINENIYAQTLEWDKVKKQLILEDIKEFKFMFYDEKKEKFVDTLNELTVNKTTPKLIKILISYQSLSRENYEGERVFRPLWPTTDTRKAIEEKYQFKNQGPSGGMTGGAADENETIDENDE